MRGLTCARPGILVNFGDSAFSGGTAPTARRAPRAHRCAMRAPNPGDAAVRARRPHLRVRVARLLASTTAPPPHAQARFAHSPAPRATQYSSQSPRTPASRHVHLVHRGISPISTFGSAPSRSHSATRTSDQALYSYLSPTVAASSPAPHLC